MKIRPFALNIWNTRHINSVKSITNSTGSLQHWGQPAEATPSILIWINTDCDRVVAAVTLSNLRTAFERR
jgi:hypothetical protein